MISVALSLIFFGKIVGTREGTIILAVFTGFIVEFLVKRLKAPIEKFAES